EWFLLIPVLAAAGWYWSGLRLWSPLRALSLLTIVAVLADPQVKQIKRGMDLWVLVDRSESAQSIVEQNFDEWKRLLLRAQPHREDRLRFVNFAGEVIEQTEGGETSVYAGNANYTRTRLALESTMAMLRPDRHARMLIFSDGYSTEPLADIGHKLEESGVPLDYRLLQAEEEVDYQITAMDIPTRKRIGEPYLVEITLRGNQDGNVPVLISRDDTEPQEHIVPVVGGKGTLQFATRLGQPGAHKYRAEIAVFHEGENAIKDAYHGNNDFEAWIEITSGPRVLLVSKYTNDPIPEMLEAQGFEVEVVSDPTQLQIGQLTGCKVLVLNNVPAFEIPQDFLTAIDFFVRRQGGGLMMVGGRHSFAAGGYYESAIDELLPVTMELKAEHRKLAVAMAIIMDRSGSMGAGVAGGMTKMDLANEGSARAVELLGNFDQITVYAVDSQAHEEVPLMPVGPNRKKITTRIRRIGSMGGGIFVYTGLNAGWKSLKASNVGQRHIILFSDAADSEEPGKYKQLIQEMTDNGGTVTVIALGTRADADAKFLDDIAARGKGRIFYTTDPKTVPNIFAQETVTVARSLFVDEAVGTSPTGAWIEISNQNFDWLSQVDGYNLSYARPKASVALVSTDEYKAPMVAYIQRGIGRVAAVSFPLGGEYSASVRGWEKMGDFVQTMNRWLMGETLPPGIGLRTGLDGTEFTLDLLHDDSWTERLAEPPRFFSPNTAAETRRAKFAKSLGGDWRLGTSA
ncbi:MAG: VWA domain-containing protein, partial [Verrucomicrobiota bacterium]